MEESRYVATNQGLVKLSSPSKRIVWIDAAKALAMILVFYGHLGGSGDNPWFPSLESSITVVYLFHMPLFFVLSGLVLNLNKPGKTFVISRLKRLVIPYFFFSLYGVLKIAIKLAAPALFASFHAKPMGGGIKELSSILLGYTNGLWFFWALLWGDLVLYLVHRATSGNTPIIAIIVIASLCAWTLVILYGPQLPFQLQTTFEAVGFVGIGYLFKHFFLALDGAGWWRLLIINLALFATCAVVKLTVRFSSDMLSTLGKAVLMIVAALTGSFVVMAIAALMYKPAWLMFIGLNTMIFYGLNGFSLAPSKKILFTVIPVSVVSSNWVLQIIVGLMCVALACTICALLTPVLKRWLWWAVGEKRPATD